MSKIPSKKHIPVKKKDISAWYLSVISHAQLADYGPARGSIILRPLSYALWENMKEVLDGTFKAYGIENVYFPLLIPYSYLSREKKHIKGFNPELALVTECGGEKLEEPLVIRPTSETIINTTLKNWIASYKDLPIKINQWCNVVRWEKRTFPFLRTSEFLWQEGHTAHTSREEAMEMTLQALKWYQSFFEKVLGMAVYVGEKSASERFAGAEMTFAIEIVIPDGKALQGATSHYFGTRFSESFDITYLDETNVECHPHQTSWGLTTRTIGGLILTHGDDNGLIMPPRIAPHQVVIVEIDAKDAQEQMKLHTHVMNLKAQLEKGGVRVLIDSDCSKSFGYRVSEIEIRGAPIRVEYGMKELKNAIVPITRRDTFQRKNVTLDIVVDYVITLLDRIHDDMYASSVDHRDAMTYEIATYEDFKRTMSEKRGFIRAYWCERAECEAKIKDETKATTRVVELKYRDSDDNGTCVYCNRRARRKWLFAQAY